mmetsp:Transcript_21344/g.53220  ORF Transcript_21344/g.53220 Transcript_21344/m.53220 type:complete len:228 (+) Transcript_21344:302-985(+)
MISSAATSHLVQSITSCGRLGSSIADVPRKVAVSSTPSRSTMKSSSAPNTKAGMPASQRARPAASAHADGRLRVKCAMSRETLLSSWKRGMNWRSRASGSAASKKSARASSAEVAADLAARPRVMRKACRSERRRKRSVIGPLPEGGTEQRRTAPLAACPASRYLSTVAPPKEWATRRGGARGGRRARTKACTSATCCVTWTARCSTGVPEVPRRESAYVSIPRAAK